MSSSDTSDELYGAAQERFRQRARPKGQPKPGRREYLFAGMVKCASGHQPLSMYGRERKSHTYMCCDYGRAYGRVAAEQIDGHGQWIYLREDNLLPLVEEFFAQRIFGPMRLSKLAEQLRIHERDTRQNGKRHHDALRRQIADLDRRLGLQLNALEKGIDPELVGARIAELHARKEQAEEQLREQPTRPNRAAADRTAHQPRTPPRPLPSPPRRPTRAQAPDLRRLRATYHLRQDQPPH